MTKLDGRRYFHITRCAFMFRLERIVTLVIFIFFLKRVGAFYCLYKENEANSSQADVAYSF